MSDTNRFGKIVTPGMVEQAVIGSLGVWIDTYLGELERLEGYPPNAIQRPRGIISTSDFEKWPEDQIPVVLVINGGLHGQPERHGQGTYTARWQVAVAAIVSDTDHAATRRLAMAYVTAIRMAVLQHAKLKSPAFPDGFADFLEWLDESYDDVPFLSSRNLAAGRVSFEVGVESAATMLAGPRTPLTPHPEVDPGSWPSAVKPDLTVVPLNAMETVS